MGDIDRAVSFGQTTRKISEGTTNNRGKDNYTFKNGTMVDDICHLYSY
jgi:hypothetical protein